MGKPRIYGMNKTFIPNSSADRTHRPKQFFRAKDRADDWERIERREYEHMCKEKKNGCL